jgi:Fic family protein
MELLPVKIIQINQKKIDEIDGLIKKIYRLIMFSRIHYDDDLLDAYVAGLNDLKTLLSIKNAQMEAQTEEEAERYILHLNKAIDFVFEEISQNQCFNREVQLFQLFRLISPEAHAVHPNRYRDTLVQVGEHLCPEPERVPRLMSELFFKLESIPNSIVRAIYFHHEFVRIHPFIDGNGRVARIGKNWILMYDLYPPIFINDVSIKKRYLSMLGHSFKELLYHPMQWNNFTESFFDQEIDLILQNTTMLYEKVNQIGLNRMN